MASNKWKQTETERSVPKQKPDWKKETMPNCNVEQVYDFKFPHLQNEIFKVSLSNEANAHALKKYEHIQMSHKLQLLCFKFKVYWGKNISHLCYKHE